MSEIKLNYPIKSSGVEINTLQMRRPRVRDLLAVAKSGGSDAEQEFGLFVNLTELSPEELGLLDMADYGKLQVAYETFLLPASQTLGELSPSVPTS